MKNYFKDPIILISTLLALVIGIILIKKNIHVTHPRQTATAAPTAIAVTENKEPQKINLTVNNMKNSGLILNKIQTKEPGVFSVGPDGDTNDLGVAIAQAGAGDVIKLASGDYELNINFYDFEKKNFHIVGVGKSTVIHLLKGIFTHALLTIENLVIEGPSSRTAIRAGDRSVVTLNKVTIKNTFMAIVLENDASLKMNNSTFERTDNSCMHQRGRSKSEIENSNFNYCIGGAIALDVLTTTVVSKSNFSDSRYAFMPENPEQAINCADCSYTNLDKQIYKRKR